MTPEIDAVVAQLDAAVATARAARDRLGYLTAMYRRTTCAVRDQVEAGAFDDADRMGQFVTRFAGRYLGPLAAWRAGQPVPRSWRVADAAAADAGKAILQHLLLGINAHVNLDLAVAAAELRPGPAIFSLHDDFLRVNAILVSLVEPVRACVGRFSPMLDVLDRVGGRDDDQILNLSIRVARDEAWSQAVTIEAADDSRHAELVDSLDRRVALLGRLVAEPGGLLGRAVDVVAATESGDVVAVIDALAQVTPPPL